MRNAWLVPLLLAAGCATTGGAPLATDPVRVTPSRDAAWPPARGETDLVVRAVTLGPEGAEEIVGASCRARSSFYAADFTAPARVLLPDFGPASPPVEVACRAGEAEGRAIAEPEPYWSGGIGGWPSVGISVGTGDISGVGVGFGWWGGGTGWNGGSSAARYPDLRVVLE